MLDMSQGQWVDCVLKKADDSGMEWLHVMVTSSGAEHITNLASALA